MTAKSGVRRARLLAWLEERTGWPAALARVGLAHVPGGVRWERSFGAALTFLFLAQLASGMGLSLGYSPGSTSAWESVARLDMVPLGHLLRALHTRGADLLIVALMLHLLQTALHGAFRAPREVTWWLGVMLAAMVFGAAFTGSLLPWDEQSRAALAVAGGTAASMPLFHGAALRLLGGGGGAINLILPRAYGLHAVVAPVAIALLLYLHASLARRHGPVPPPALPPDALNQRHSYWPGQALSDALFSLGAVVALTALALLRPAPLQGPADPSASLAGLRPAWYFRPLTELLRDLPAALLPVIALLPLLLFALLLALPLLARPGGSRLSPRAPGWAVAAMVAIATILGATSFVRDLRSPTMRQERSLAEARAQLARKLAEGGTPSEGILFRLQDQPAARGARLFERRCLACHRAGERGASFGPSLTDYLSRAWLRGLVLDANQPDYYGTSGLRGMEPQELDEESLDLVVELLHSLRDLPAGTKALPPSLEGGRRVFESSRCSQCHTLDAGKSSLGPSLAGYGSAAWLDGLLRDPAAPGYFGAQNQMVVSGGKLTDSEREDLVAYLQTLETR